MMDLYFGVASFRRSMHRASSRRMSNTAAATGWRAWILQHVSTLWAAPTYTTKHASYRVRKPPRYAASFPRDIESQRKLRADRVYDALNCSFSVVCTPFGGGEVSLFCSQSSLKR